LTNDALLYHLKTFVICLFSRDALIVCLTCGGTSFYAGFVIFSIIGFMAFETGLPVGEVITQGEGHSVNFGPLAVITK